MSDYNIHYQISTWKVEIRYGETHHSFVTHFATEEAAQLAVEWAYEVHFEQLRSRYDISNIQQWPDPKSTHWKNKDLYGKKLLSYQSIPGQGWVAHKDYFTAEKDVFERTVVG